VDIHEKARALGGRGRAESGKRHCQEFANCWYAYVSSPAPSGAFHDVHCRSGNERAGCFPCGLAYDKHEAFAHGSKRDTHSTPSTKSVYCLASARNDGDGAYARLRRTCLNICICEAAESEISAVLLRSDDYFVQIPFILQMSSLDSRQRSMARSLQQLWRPECPNFLPSYRR
jgi:hypothetical protein